MTQKASSPPLPLICDIDRNWNPIRDLVFQNPEARQDHLETKLQESMVCGLWAIADNDETSARGAANFLVDLTIGIATICAMAELRGLQEWQANRGIQLELPLD